MERELIEYSGKESAIKGRRTGKKGIWIGKYE